MASTVQTGGGSGVDLSELTSGELLFCSLLKTGYIHVQASGSSSTYVDFGFDNWNVDTNGKSADMSKISQISFKASDYGVSGRVSWINESRKYTQTNFSLGNSFSISAPSGDNSHSMFTISTDSSDNPAAIVKVTSFTTTDGKVHTANNLNY